MVKSSKFNVINPDVLLINFFNYAVASDTVKLNLDNLVCACNSADKIISKNQDKYKNCMLNISYNRDIIDEKLRSYDINNTMNTFVAWGCLLNINNLSEDYLILGLTSDNAKDYVKNQMDNNIKAICELIFTEYENLISLNNAKG